MFELAKMDFDSLMAKVEVYKVILKNTIIYREKWATEMKPGIRKVLEDFISHAGLKAEIKTQEKIENLESIVLDLGHSSSGISESMEDTDVKRTMIKSNGALIYQQLFNGKVMVMIANPNIEGYADPKAPISLEILRPEEIKAAVIIRHLETFMKNITEWEDYDDNQPSKSPIGFQPIKELTELIQ
ncbi:MAG: hypothetical protein ABI844_12865, partial [Saprospiraceae bacterium]